MKDSKAEMCRNNSYLMFSGCHFSPEALRPNFPWVLQGWHWHSQVFEELVTQ